jgi:hypothetical protein
VGAQLLEEERERRVKADGEIANLRTIVDAGGLSVRSGASSSRSTRR